MSTNTRLLREVRWAVHCPSRPSRAGRHSGADLTLWLAKAAVMSERANRFLSAWIIRLVT
eukprot:scaffold144394_cov145-Phaeocystis_antarctica.AAC.1